MLDELRRLLREHMNTYADDLATGVATDYAKYREIVGTISGLAIAERELLDLETAQKKRDFAE